MFIPAEGVNLNKYTISLYLPWILYPQMRGVFKHGPYLSAHFFFRLGQLAAVPHGLAHLVLSLRAVTTPRPLFLRHSRLPA